MSGYVGESITLPSGVNSSWDVARVEWSVFTNSTFIATYRNGHEKTQRFHQFLGRLRLDTSTGDLQISGLRREDALVYSVEITNRMGTLVSHKITLTLRGKDPFKQCTSRCNTYCDSQIDVLLHTQLSPISIVYIHITTSDIFGKNHHYPQLSIGY